MICSPPTDNPLDKAYYPQLSILSGQFLHANMMSPDTPSSGTLAVGANANHNYIS